MPVQTQVQMRRDTAANWTSTNPTLASGEWGLETDTRLMKIGDGTTAWNSLSYQLGPLLDEVIPTDPNGAYFTGSGFRINGTSTNVASTPDAAALDITGDIDLRVKVAMDDWTPAAAQTLIGKWGSGTSGTDSSFILYLLSTGRLRLSWWDTAVRTVDSALLGLTDGSTKWVRATLDVDNGASGRDITFYTSDDGTNWTQLGTTVTQAGVTSIINSNKALDVGARSGTNDIAIGTFYRAQVLNGIGGTTVFDANFENVAADSFAFTESSANAATVTLTTTRYWFSKPGISFTGTPAGGYSVSANLDYYEHFKVIGKPITIKHIAFYTAAPATNGTSYVAIYAVDNMQQPTGAPLYSSSAITISSAAAAVYRIRVTPFVLPPGNYVTAYNTDRAYSMQSYTGNVGGAANNVLGNGILALTRVSRTTAPFTSSPLKWNSASISTTGRNNVILLGW